MLLDQKTKVSRLINKRTAKLFTIKKAYYWAK